MSDGRPRVFASTACLPFEEPLDARLHRYAAAGITRVELGARVFTDPETLARITDREDLEVLVHNYFPPPEDPFVLNLASGDRVIRRRSLELARSAVELCAELRAPFYTVHAGFIVDPDGFNGTSFTFPDPGPAAEAAAMDRFVAGVRELVQSADTWGVQLLIENNVCPPSLVGKLLLQTPDEFEVLLSRIETPTLGVLMDTGHLNVAATTLGFDRLEFPRRLGDRIAAVHLHDNDGSADQHRPAALNSWAFETLKMVMTHGGTVAIVEASFPDEVALGKHVQAVEEALVRARQSRP